MCKTFLHISLDFDFSKYLSVGAAEETQIKTFSGPRAPAIASPPDYKTIYAFNWPHTCVDLVPNSTTIKVDSLQEGKMDTKYFERIIEDHPYEKLMYFVRQATIDHKFFKQSTLERLVLASRKILFPNDEKDIFNNLYCKTLDAKSEDRLDFYHGKGEVLDKKGKLQKYVVLATKFSLRALAKSEIWYLDGTFKIVPSKYYQLYIWMAKYDGLNVPCAYIFMTSKCEALYNVAFNHIKNQCSTYLYKIVTKTMILDFEKGSRAAMKEVFPGIEMKGCYFHFAQCLWKNAKKKGLCDELTKLDTVLLIGFLKILVHIEEHQRKELYAELKQYFIEKQKLFKNFLQYFEDNWLENDFLNFKALKVDDLRDRTNNVSEAFNSVLNKHVGMYKPN